MASNKSPSSFTLLTELADALLPAEPAEQVNPDVLCDIEDPVLFQAVLTRLKSMLNEDEWLIIANKLASLSPRSLIVALAAGQFSLNDLRAKRLEWMLRDPNPYILNRPTMMHEVRELNMIVSPQEQRIFPPLHHFTSLRKLHCGSDSSLPDDAFSLVRQHVTGLRDLLVSTPHFTAPMLNDIAHMTSLEVLGLKTVEFDVIPPLGNLQGLKVLAILDDGREGRNEALVLPSILEGLTRIERLVLGVRISDDLAEVMPTMFPMLRALGLCQIGLSENVVASLRSHYENMEGFALIIM